MMNASLAELIAREAHKDQTRWDGSPYIEHPKYIASQMQTKAEKEVAWLHDVVEDTETTLEELKELFDDNVINALDAISKRKGEDYAVYILRLSENYLATKVKLQDLEHNLSDLRKGSMRDKYMLAHLFLKEKLVRDIL